MTRYYGHVKIELYVEAASEEEARQMLRDRMAEIIAGDDDVLLVLTDGQKDWDDWTKTWLVDAG